MSYSLTAYLKKGFLLRSHKSFSPITSSLHLSSTQFLASDAQRRAVCSNILYACLVENNKEDLFIRALRFLE